MPTGGQMEPSEQLKAVPVGNNPVFSGPIVTHINEGIRYARAGTMVTDLRPTGNQAPLSLFENSHEERHIGTLLEDVTRRYGRGSIGLGYGGIRGGPDCAPPRKTTDT
ncbi:hypothetical protein GCM10007170_28360 [Arthrobacter liuii]|uniref:DUF4113 domain-containing protein n=1 Tax=Arthrobacter liuii TaxID=1476996 RepID=A0ABQ2AWM6_9MICC|nr:hypothetical protein GCM10007170_28360 [Arthrobacter liuii]